MKQKYILEKKINDGKYTLKEFGELSPGIFTMMCTEQYNAKALDEAMGQELNQFFDVLRTNNIFPPLYLANKLFEAAIGLKDAKEDETIEVLFNDLESISKEEELSELELKSIEAEGDDENDDVLAGLFNDESEESDSTNAAINVDVIAGSSSSMKIGTNIKADAGANLNADIDISIDVDTKINTDIDTNINMDADKK
ncbi:MAG: hypothetical protein B6I31_01020 [Desulfobacteraceae bacterium 4572_19]|nr:MAG: hypothetical protein B6I31_01020 [Desulfobacteraceae bacterium 4572_19]